MNAFTNWWNTPWTNGSFVKLCIGSAVVSTIGMAVMSAGVKHMVSKAVSQTEVEPKEIDDDDVVITQTINPESNGDL